VRFGVLAIKFNYNRRIIGRWLYSLHPQQLNILLWQGVVVVVVGRAGVVALGDLELHQGLQFPPAPLLQ
jgi:hypothetical protein